MRPRNVEYIDRAARPERIGAQDKHGLVFQGFIQLLFVIAKFVPTIVFTPKRIAADAQAVETLIERKLQLFMPAARDLF